MKIISSVTSDLFSDQRVHRICQSLSSHGFEIELIGRKKRTSPEMAKRSYKTKRMKLIIEKGALFYFEFNFRLFLKLLFKKTDILLANDLDTLLANYLVSILKQKPLFYDSHEYFTEVPELTNRKMVKRIWTSIESMCIRRVKKAFTVSDSIAAAYKEKYGIDFQVIRNLPEMTNSSEKAEINLRDNSDQKILIYQGSVNVDRGLEEMIDAMALLENYKLVILGHGDVLEDLEQRVESKGLNKKVEFKGRVPLADLNAYTIQADLGISIEKKNGLSYTYALPNKFFDYIQACIPILISDLPEMIKVNEKYHVAAVLQNHSPNTIAETVQGLLNDQEKIDSMKEHSLKAREDLNWEKESTKLLELFDDFSDRA